MHSIGLVYCDRRIPECVLRHMGKYTVPSHLYANRNRREAEEGAQIIAINSRVIFYWGVHENGPMYSVDSQPMKYIDKDFN
jgi:hypothetical protein